MINHITLQNKDKNVLETIRDKQLKMTFLRRYVPVISDNKTELGQMFREQYFAESIF